MGVELQLIVLLVDKFVSTAWCLVCFTIVIKSVCAQCLLVCCAIIRNLFIMYTRISITTFSMVHVNILNTIKNNTLVLILMVLCFDFCLQGIRFLIDSNLLKNTSDDIAQFLYKGEGLNKTAIGDYLGERWVILMFLPTDRSFSLKTFQQLSFFEFIVPFNATVSRDIQYNVMILKQFLVCVYTCERTNPGSPVHYSELVVHWQV